VASWVSPSQLLLYCNLSAEALPLEDFWLLMLRCLQAWVYVCEELREVVVAFRGTEQVSMHNTVR
jgi:hypothetical protein